MTEVGKIYKNKIIFLRKAMIRKPQTGGEVLLKKKGKKYFSKLAKDGWKKRRENLAKWKKENGKN